MKKLILCGILLSQLSGCALYETYVQAKYDANEYALINTIRTETDNADEFCSTSQISTLKHDVALFANYAELTPHNDNVATISKNMNTLVTEFYTKVNSEKSVSPAYCKAKITTINSIAKQVQTIIGKKPR